MQFNRTLTVNISTKDKLRSGEIQVRGDQWPIFIYAGYAYDPEDPWNGLLRSQLLVCVRLSIILKKLMVLTH